jgi:hypothetical protein
LGLTLSSYGVVNDASVESNPSHYDPIECNSQCETLTGKNCELNQKDGQDSAKFYCNQNYERKTLRSYLNNLLTFFNGENTLGNINIAKDMPPTWARNHQ